MRINRMRSVPAGEVERRCGAFVRLCRARGVRVTAQRLAVYRALAEAPWHPTAHAVYRRLRAHLPSLAPATVYRVLDVLVAEGILRRVSTTGGAARFDANLEPHHHLVCRVCGRLTDVFAGAIGPGRLAAAIPRDFVVEAVDVRIVGRCLRCGPAAAPAPRARRAARAGRGPSHVGPRPRQD
jgi:Fe2+ or Zn2+ uptake regulation protein